MNGNQSTIKTLASECEELIGRTETMLQIHQAHLQALVHVAMTGTAIVVGATGLNVTDKKRLIELFQTLYASKPLISDAAHRRVH